MHRTDTLDYVVVISGDIEMQTDDETTQLKAGDVLVQRGTNHSWINRSERNATLAFVLIDAIPIGIGQAITGNATAK
jgi:quercetin dioxygenase-like cupin family protein